MGNKIFISYAKNDTKMEEIKKLKINLQKDGFDIIIDDDELKTGDELTEFIENSIRESNYILVICTPEYKKRANTRKENPTGVAYEARILADHVYNKTKIIIPIIQVGDLNSMPDFLKGYMAIFLNQTSEAEEYKQNYAKLIKELKRKDNQNC